MMDISKVLVILLGICAWSFSVSTYANEQNLATAQVIHHQKTLHSHPNDKIAILNPAPIPLATDKKPTIFPGININGNIRSYFFDRTYGKNQLNNQDAFAVGGKLNLLSEAFWHGFRLGGTVYTSQSLGLNSSNPTKVDASLPASPVTVLGQAFLQYQNTYLLARLGDQLITTPWMNEADSRMIPAAYQGMYLKANPTPDLSLIAMRMIGFKARIVDNYSHTNLYNPINGGTPIAQLGSRKNSGALAMAAQYKPAAYDPLNMQIWGYQFYNFGKLAYADAAYTFQTGTIVRPIVSAQIGKEWGDGKQILQAQGLGATNSNIYGVSVGIETADGKLTIAYNNLPKHTGAWRSGNVVSPYTTSYASDPLYTTSMIAGLIEKAAGSAIKITGQYAFFDKKLKLQASYASYQTQPFVANTTEEDVDVTYLPQGVFKNLSIRYRVGLLNGNATYRRFITNRLMLQYNFG